MTANATLPTINTLWIGESLSYIEQLCLLSMLTRGHRVVLYSYDPVAGVPDGIEQRDAAEVLPRDRIIRHKSGSYALTADLFRYRILEQGLGCWSDADSYFIRPLVLDGDHIYGWESQWDIAMGVLYLAPSSPVLQGLLELCTADPVMLPWWTFKARAKQRVLHALGWAKPVSRMPWGTIGPKALTYFAKKYGVINLAKDRQTFYPVSYYEADLLFDPTVDVESYFSDQTVTVHLWNNYIKDRKNEPPPAGSFIDKACRQHGISIK